MLVAILLVTPLALSAAMPFQQLRCAASLVISAEGSVYAVALAQAWLARKKLFHNVGVAHAAN